jgi:hypothetical protein
LQHVEGEKRMSVVVTAQEFWDYKVGWFIQMWKYGRHDDQAFAKNMTHMGYSEDMIKECLEEFYSEE